MLDEELSVAEGYAAWAPFYDEDGNPLIPLEGPAVRDLFGPIAGRRALDLGCGTGRHTRALLDAGARVAALDFSAAMMDRARSKLAGRPVAWVRHALPRPLPFPGATFDLVVMGLVAEHVSALHAVLAEVGRVLRPGGRIILSALHPDRTAAGQRARFIDPATGVRRPIATIHRTVEEYLALARAAGLEEVAWRTLIVPAEHAERYPRAARYVGEPLGWVACWRKPGLSP